MKILLLLLLLFLTASCIDLADPCEEYYITEIDHFGYSVTLKNVKTGDVIIRTGYQIYTFTLEVLSRSPVTSLRWCE